MHHDDELWDEPMKFWPERFFDKNNQKLGEELYQFGLGKSIVNHYNLGIVYEVILY